MHLLILTHHFPPEFSGDATMQHELARHMASHGHKATVITTYPHHHMVVKDKDSRLPRRTTESGVDVIRMRTPRWTRKYLPLRAVQDFIAETEYVVRAMAVARADVVLLWSPPITLPLQALWLKWIRRTRVLTYMQDAFPEALVALGLLQRQNPALRVGEWLESFVYRNSNYVAVHSPRNRNHVLKHGGRPSQTHVWPLWVDSDAVEPRPRENPFAREQALTGKFVVMYAGTVGHAVGWKAIVDAAALLRGHPGIEFVIVGDGPQLSSLKAGVAQRELANLRILPLQPRDTLPEMLASADALLISLRAETTDNEDGYFRSVIPHKVLTSMAAARPILACTEPDGDLARLIHTADCGLVAAADNPQELAQAVLTLHANPELRAKWAANARDFVCRHFSNRTQLPILERVLVALAAGETSPPGTVWETSAIAMGPSGLQSPGSDPHGTS